MSMNRRTFILAASASAAAPIGASAAPQAELDTAVMHSGKFVALMADDAIEFRGGGQYPQPFFRGHKVLVTDNMRPAEHIEFLRGEWQLTRRGRLEKVA